MIGKLVFVYGTLRKGDIRFGIETLIDLVHPEAHLEGFQLIHLGGFPGIVPGKGRVRGEVHLYTTFDQLDAIEGHRKERPENSLFRRTKVIVELPFGEELQASTYVYNSKPRRGCYVIDCGDWFSGEAQARTL